MGSRGVGKQSFAVEDKQLVDAVRQYLLLHLALDSCTGHDCMQLNIQFIGELTTLCKQLLRYFCYCSILHFAIEKHSLTPGPSPRGEGSRCSCILIIILRTHIYYLFNSSFIRSITDLTSVSTSSFLNRMTRKPFPSR